MVQAAGAQVILMASRALAASARSARDYLEVYGSLLKQADRPVILHWLGEAFDPMLRGYWGSEDLARPPGPCSTCSPRRTAGSTASSCPSSTTAPRYRSGAGCRPGSACTPATTCTTTR